MSPWAGWLLLLAYVAGLLATALPWNWNGVPLAGGALFCACGLASLVMPRLWRRGPVARQWLLMGAIALFATIYYGLRMPVPQPGDVSKLIPPEGTGTSLPVVTVRGEIDSTPRLTRGDRIQFWLKSRRILELSGQTEAAQTTDTATGRLYVTVPLLQGSSLFPQQVVDVTGTLYKPKGAAYVGGFDFSEYLARQGGFAGLKAYQLTGTAENARPPLGWKLRKKIIRIQAQALGSPRGPLLSAMVLGSRSVDLPFDVKDRFRTVGLSHVIAVSGFHVALVLGVVLQLTRRLSARFQFLLGSSTLLSLLVLTGLQPSVLRAVLMGLGAMTALVMRRKTKPLGALILTAVLLLLFNPIWIWDLGFQLSFLATLGLLVTVPALMRRLDWLPTLLASAIAIPLAATLWTLPLQLYHFGVTAPYGIVVNLLVTPLVMVTTLGGFLSAALGLIWAPAGGSVAYLAGIGTQAMDSVAQLFAQLPGANFSLGKLTLFQVAVFYSLLLLIRLSRTWQKRWWIVGGLMAIVVVLPLHINQRVRVQLTVLADNPPVLVVQDKGQVGLVNCGNSATVRGQVIPFLQHQGINNLDWAISTQTDSRSGQGWLRLLDQISIAKFYESIPQSPANQPKVTQAIKSPEQSSISGTTSLSTINNQQLPKSSTNEPQAANNRQTTQDNWIRQQLETALIAQKSSYSQLRAGQTFGAGEAQISIDNNSDRLWHYRRNGLDWLWLFQLDLSQQDALAKSNPLAPVDLLWWSGESIASSLLEQAQPKAAIAAARTLDPDTLRLMANKKVDVYWTGRDGAVQWSPSGNSVTDSVRPSRESLEIDTSPL